MAFSVEAVRKDFPVLSQKHNGNPLIYFDNACMSLRPEQVVSKIMEYYHEYPGCAGRSQHLIAQRTNEEVRNSRRAIQRFINAKKPEEIVFTKNTTEALNLVYRSLPLRKGEVIVTTDKEHNSSLLPVQWLVKSKELVHVAVPSAEDNTFSIAAFEKLLAQNKEVKLVSMVGSSNLDGTTIPIKEIAKLAHDSGALLMIDGAQLVPHHETDVRKLGIDFLAFSGHKMMGPSGIGVLYGREELLGSLPPFLLGGGTVFDSTYEAAKFEKSPAKFEAGLQDYAGIVGLGEAVSYLSRRGVGSISAHELAINKRISDALLPEKSVSLIGPADPKLRGSIFSFNIGKSSSHDVATMLSVSKNIAVRSGAHCVHSWFNAHNLNGSVRASFYAYNTLEEADVFVDAVRIIIRNIH